MFISYAQNFEDVMLWRALKHIECGFYIDVGANDPDVDSITKAFYDHGWRGINVEPISDWFEKIQEKRPRDINLQLAAGSKKGDLVIYELPDTGLSTTDKSTAQRHEEKHGFRNLERTVPVETLTEICHRFHVAPIHFLKIDVEGAEKDVLLGIDFSVIRPWIVLVESTLPLTQVEAYEQWEPILLDAGYEYVYFDGLSRFYIAQEHSEIKTFFSTPPNIFDGFVLGGLATHPFCNFLAEKVNAADSRAQKSSECVAEAEAKAQQADAKAQQAEAKAQQAEAKAQQAEAKAQQADAKAVAQEQRAIAEEARVIAILSTKSWRITWPLRKAMPAAKWVVALPARALRWALRLPKRIAKPMMVWAMRQTLANPGLKSRALNVLNKHPILKQHLRQFAIRSGWSIASTARPTSTVPLSRITNINIPASGEVDIASTASTISTVPLSPITNVNIPASAPVDEGYLHASLVRATQAWPLGVRKNG